MATYFAGEAQLHQFLRQVDPGHTYVALRRELGVEYCQLQPDDPDQELALRDERPSVSPKPFLMPPRECVARYSTAGEGKKGEADEADKGRVEHHTLVGLRACDIAAAEYLDKVFLEGESEEPFYKARRESQVVISVDCTSIHEKCFCDVVGGKPFATGGFDLNISPISSGYLLWVGTGKGQQLIDAHKELFREATPEEIEEVRKQRQKTSEELTRQNKGLKLTEHLQRILEDMEDDQWWETYCGRCVECAACTNICPTCHCFYLYDRTAGKDDFERIKTWDSCLTADYSRMAGVGGNKPNPRTRLRTRFANRFLHKYRFSPIQYGVLGCTGCGRCLEACFGAVDIRKVLEDIEQAGSVAAGENPQKGKKGENTT